jgi:hypothetical protein
MYRLEIKLSYLFLHICKNKKNARILQRYLIILKT